jgi:hypothetical protein
MMVRLCLAFQPKDYHNQEERSSDKDQGKTVQTSCNNGDCAV